MIPFTGQGDDIGVVGVGIAQHHKNTMLREESYKAYGLRMKQLEEKGKVKPLPIQPLRKVIEAVKPPQSSRQSRDSSREVRPKLVRAQSSSNKTREAIKPPTCSPKLNKKKQKRPTQSREGRDSISSNPMSAYNSPRMMEIVPNNPPSPYNQPKDGYAQMDYINNVPFRQQESFSMEDVFTYLSTNHMHISTCQCVQGNSVYSGNIQVALRVRPLIGRERSEASGVCVFPIEYDNEYTSDDKDKLAKVMLAGNKLFGYDVVFTEHSSQGTVFKCVVEPLIDSFFEGYNSTVLAYGQTGSGKSYTMGDGAEYPIIDVSAGGLGTISDIFPPDSTDGIIPRTLLSIFLRLSRYNQSDFSTRISFLELYNDDLIDLLLPPDAPYRPKLQIRERADQGHAEKTIFIPELTEISTKSLADALRLFMEGSENRSSAATAMNEKSSRSHSIFMLSLDLRREDNVCVRSRFCLVDLAGSERAKRSGINGVRLREMIDINSGLLALGNVINALSHKGQKAPGPSHIPYRDSKLTRLLQNSLGGSANTVMIACVSPADSNYDETLSTMSYAARARLVRNTPKADKEVRKDVIDTLREEIRKLEEELEKTRIQKREERKKYIAYMEELKQMKDLMGPTKVKPVRRLKRSTKSKLQRQNSPETKMGPQGKQSQVGGRSKLGVMIDTEIENLDRSLDMFSERMRGMERGGKGRETNAGVKYGGNEEEGDDNDNNMSLLSSSSSSSSLSSSSPYQSQASSPCVSPPPIVGSGLCEEEEVSRIPTAGSGQKMLLDYIDVDHDEFGSRFSVNEVADEDSLSDLDLPFADAYYNTQASSGVEEAAPPEREDLEMDGCDFGGEHELLLVERNREPMDSGTNHGAQQRAPYRFIKTKAETIRETRDVAKGDTYKDNLMQSLDRYMDDSMNRDSSILGPGAPLGYQNHIRVPLSAGVTQSNTGSPEHQDDVSREYLNDLNRLFEHSLTLAAKMKEDIAKPSTGSSTEATRQNISGYLKEVNTLIQHIDASIHNCSGTGAGETGSSLARSTLVEGKGVRRGKTALDSVFDELVTPSEDTAYDEHTQLDVAKMEMIHEKIFTLRETLLKETQNKRKLLKKINEQSKQLRTDEEKFKRQFVEIEKLKEMIVCGSNTVVSGGSVGGVTQYNANGIGKVGVNGEKGKTPGDILNSTDINAVSLSLMKLSNSVEARDAVQEERQQVVKEKGEIDLMTSRSKAVLTPLLEKVTRKFAETKERISELQDKITAKKQRVNSKVNNAAVEQMEALLDKLQINKEALKYKRNKLGERERMITLANEYSHKLEEALSCLSTKFQYHQHQINAALGSECLTEFCHCLKSMNPSDELLTLIVSLLARLALTAQERSGASDAATSIPHTSQAATITTAATATTLVVGDVNEYPRDTPATSDWVGKQPGCVYGLREDEPKQQNDSPTTSSNSYSSTLPPHLPNTNFKPSRTSPVSLDGVDACSSSGGRSGSLSAREHSRTISSDRRRGTCLE